MSHDQNRLPHVAPSFLTMFLVIPVTSHIHAGGMIGAGEYESPILQGGPVYADMRLDSASLVNTGCFVDGLV